MKDKHVIFMGTPAIAAKVLQALIDSEVHIDLVVTQPDKKVGRKQKVVFSPVKQLALEHQLPIYQPTKIRQDHQLILETPCDLIVTCAYGQIVPDSILQHPSHKCINLHASLLPAYRGGAPIQRAIWEGKKETGMTLMYMDSQMDAGDMIAQRSIAIDEEDNSTTLFDKMGDLACELLKENLDSLLSGEAQSRKQEPELVTYAPIIRREEEKIDLSKTDKEIIDQIRALANEPGAYVEVNGKKLKITQFKYIKAENTHLGTFTMPTKKSLAVDLHEGRLEILQCQLEGKPSMDIKSFVNGHGKNLVGQTAA